MIITAPTSTTSSNAAGAVDTKGAARDKALGKSDFLTMLMAQIKNQDPLNPMDNTEFTAQMAQFTSLEQLFNVNDTLNMMVTSINSQNSVQALNIIGKEVTANGQNVHVKNGVSSDIAFTLPETASSVKIVVEDAAGNVVKTIARGSMDEGDHTVTWNPTNDSGAQMDDGLYSYSVIAEDKNGKPIEASTFTKGIASGIAYEDGVAYVFIGNAKYMLSEITEVSTPKENNSSAA